jgi:hypothetical protein
MAVEVPRPYFITQGVSSRRDVDYIRFAIVALVTIASTPGGEHLNLATIGPGFGLQAGVA